MPLVEKMLIAILIILIIIYIKIHIDDCKNYKEAENLLKNWNNEFCYLGNFIQNEEIANVYYIKDLYILRLEVTIKKSSKTETETFKIPYFKPDKELENCNSDINLVTVTNESTKWKIELFCKEEINVKEKTKKIYEIQIFVPNGMKVKEYSSK